MRTPKMFTQSEGSLIAEYAQRMNEAVSRRNAELEIRAARIEAELAIKARSEFLANMNHELRTPLNAIIGFATMLRDARQFDLNEEQVSTYSSYILQSADLLLGHINTVLEVAALESGKVEIDDGEVDLCVLLVEAIDRVEIQAKAAGVCIERRDSGVDAIGWGDSERTSQALDHLLLTAIKACGDGGKVLVRAGVTDKGWAEVAVRDSGDGMKAEDIRDALNAFKQVHRGLDRSFSGPGIGYAIAKTFTEMQGGRFSIKSQVGQGTLARITLPPPEHAFQTHDGANSKSIDQSKTGRVHDAA